MKRLYLIFVLLISFSCKNEKSDIFINENNTHWKVYIVNRCYLNKNLKNYYEKWIFNKQTYDTYIKDKDGEFTKRNRNSFDAIYSNKWNHRNDSLFIGSNNLFFKIYVINNDSIKLVNYKKQCKVYNKSGVRFENIPTVYILSRGKD